MRRMNGWIHFYGFPNILSSVLNISLLDKRLTHRQTTDGQSLLYKCVNASKNKLEVRKLRMWQTVRNIRPSMKEDDNRLAANGAIQLFLRRTKNRNLALSPLRLQYATDSIQPHLFTLLPFRKSLWWVLSPGPTTHCGNYNYCRSC